MMYSEMMRRLRDVEAEIESIANGIESAEYRYKIARRWVNYYNKKLDTVCNATLITEIDLKYIKCYLSSIKDYFRKMCDSDTEIQEYLKILEPLKNERKQLLERMHRYRGSERGQDFDELDYTLFIGNDGFIHGTKL